MPKLSKVLLLCDGPRFTDILLEEPAREKEVDGLYMWGTNVEAITEEFLQADMSFFAPSALSLNIRDLMVPPLLSSREKEDIAQRRVEGMVISDPLKSMARHSVQDDVLSVSRPLSISWHDDSDLLDIVSWSLVAAPISGCIKAQGNAAILLWRDVSHQMDCLFIKSNGRVAAMQHVLKGTKNDGIQISIK